MLERRGDAILRRATASATAPITASSCRSCRDAIVGARHGQRQSRRRPDADPSESRVDRMRSITSPRRVASRSVRQQRLRPARSSRPQPASRRRERASTVAIATARSLSAVMPSDLDAGRRPRSPRPTAAAWSPGPPRSRAGGGQDSSRIRERPGRPRRPSSRAAG